MKRWEKINKYIILYFLFAFVPRFLLILFMQPLNVPLDESATLALPAYLAGYDWSYLMGKTKYYYGYGMSILFTPFFFMFKDPAVLYRVLLSACALLQTVPGFIAFHILGAYFGQTNNKIKLILSLIASYCVCSTATNVYNEHMLYIIAWIAAWMILALINCKKNSEKVYYTIFLTSVLFYALTCHNRSKVFIAAILGVIALYGIFQRKCLVSPVAFIMTSSLAYKVVLLTTAKVQSVIWPVESGKAALANTSTAVDLNLLKNKEALYVWLNLILGQLGTGAVFTGGILITAIILAGYMSVKKIKDMRLGTKYIDNNYFYVMLFGLMTIGATILAQSVNGIPNAQKAIADSTANEGGRIFTYLRYYFPCVGSLIVLSVNWLISCKSIKRVKIIMWTAFGGVAALQMNFVLAILPLIEKTPVINYIHTIYWNFSFKTDGDWTSRYTFLPACVICVLLFLVFLFLIIKGKKGILLFLIVGLLGYQYVMLSVNTGIIRSNKNYQAVGETWTVLDKMQKSNVLPDYIGVTEKKVHSTNQPVRFIYQYLLQDRRISYQEKVSDKEEAVFLEVCLEIPRVIKDDTASWHAVKLSENQYIFFKGKRLERYFEEENYDYITVQK